MRASPRAILEALGRARAPILWIWVTYLLGVVVEAGMVHAHNDYALRYGDRLVGDAQQSDPAAKALQHGLPVRAALTDFVGNLVRGAMPSTVMGLGIVLPFPLATFRGWVGGIVSVNGQHVSRLRDGRERWYYRGVLLLQLIPFILAGGAGVRLGLAFLFPRSRWGYAAPQRWLGLPSEGVRDVLRIYILIVPLFLIASLVEFLAQ